MNDMEIIELYWQRDEEAIRQTEKAYGSRLLALSRRILGSPEDAQECVSDTYMKAWETIPPQEPRFLFAYLGKICRNFSLGRLDWRNAAKRKGEIVSLSDEMALCIPDERRGGTWEGRELGRVINDFLGTIDRESRMIFMRRYWYCDTTEEIAKRFSFSESKVKTRLHRTRKQLKVYLEREGIAV